ncbi:contact-dependent growth inhibition system immunity protein [Proteus columbae]|uniref:contact-dependent growth inhibition system immunity protein n=1 Tax=Proteus columbae TaxID=1987580 RepID=UPI0018C8222B|nr:contact-dependent growth inhibition system immunity protein [Proteus columbae]MBG2712306.1 CdiI family contact-dependent growth inhibition immunity protein [Proteus mirabilis]MBG2767802.1 CdiI family contact-dependent growth inhibition immunity protein [Proteus mirabilis]
MIKSKYYNLYADIYFNNDYYIIVTISGYYIHFMDFKNGYNILSNDITNTKLGYYAKISLINSRKIESNSQEFHEMYNDKKSYPEWIKKIIKEYGYKNKTALFENMNLCSLSIVDNEIIIRPQNHLRMDHWVGEGIPDSAIITLKTNCSDEVLGASIKEAFTRCISRKV